MEKRLEKKTRKEKNKDNQIQPRGPNPRRPAHLTNHLRGPKRRMARGPEENLNVADWWATGHCTSARRHAVVRGSHPSSAQKSGLFQQTEYRARATSSLGSLSTAAIVVLLHQEG
jgi:hypothetical protein